MHREHWGNRRSQLCLALAQASHDLRSVARILEWHRFHCAYRACMFSWGVVLVRCQYETVVLDLLRADKGDRVKQLPPRVLLKVHM